MAVNKNFVVKNGLEVSTDLIFADASTEKVGIGSTIPATQLDVVGGIAATDLNVTGVTTVVTLRGTTGIVTTIDAISIQATNLVVTGVSTGISVGTQSELLVTGVTSTGSLQVVGTGNIPVGIITNAQGTNLNYGGIGTIATLNSTALVASSAKVSDLTDNRVVVAGTSGELEDSANLTFDGTQLTGTGNLKITGVGTINNVIMTADASGIGATVGAAVGVVTYYGDGVNLTNVSGQGVGVRTTGAIVGYGFTILNFIGAGNTFAVDGKTVDISIAGGGGGGSVSIGSEAPDSPSSGSLWYHTEYGRTFVYYDEVTLGIGNTAVWVDAAPFNQGGQFINKYGDNALGAIGYTGGTTSQASIYYTGDPNTGIYFPAADTVGIVAGGSNSLKVNSAGATIGSGVTVNNTGIDAGIGAAANTGIVTAKLFQGQGANFSTYATKAVYQGKIVGTAATIGLGVTINNTGIDAGISAGFVTTKYVQGMGANFSTYATKTVYSGKIVGTAATIGLGVTINNTGIDAGIAAGIITAKEYHGDGSNLSGISAGGSGQFNTSISSATAYLLTTSMAVAKTASASASIRTVVHSIHIVNISASEVTVSGEMQSSFSFAHTIPVPAGSAVELLKQPKVLGPSETIELQASAGGSLYATIILEEKEDTALWDAQVDVTSAATYTDLYTSTTYPSVVQSILLANDDGDSDVKARVIWTDGSDSLQSYLCYDMVIPADSTVELCEQPKYLAAGYKLRVYANQADRLEVTASGSQIVS